MRLITPLKYHGGKFYLADKIISMMCEHLHYVEPYFGGGQVLLRKPCDSTSECVNDIDGDLMNFWTVLRDADSFAVLNRMVVATPVSEPLWLDSYNEIKKTTQTPDINRAYYFFIKMRQSRQGLGKSFTTLSKTRLRRGMQESVSSWLSAIEGLPAIHERLKRVVIFSKDALEVIKEQDSQDSLFYCDPPYVLETRTAKTCYNYEMTNEQHEQLLSVLSQITGKFILSGYNNNLYESYAIKYSWNIEIINIKNNASSKSKKGVKNEYIWRNY